MDLTVEDDENDTAMCTAKVTVQDTLPPTIICNAPSMIVPPDAPISFIATATDVCDAEVDAVITGFDCFKFTKKGKRIDKTASCQVSVDGDTITILDSGGVGTHITWTVDATDGSQNQSQTECEVEVANPGRS